MFGKNKVDDEEREQSVGATIGKGLVIPAILFGIAFAIFVIITLSSNKNKKEQVSTESKTGCVEMIETYDFNYNI